MNKLQTKQDGDMCPYCGKGTLYIKPGKWGDFLGCNRYPKCAGLIAIKKEKDPLEKQADQWLEEHK